MPFAMRVSLLDQPGALARLCDSLGGAGCNIVTVDVVERADGYAVDDMVVEAPGRTPGAIRQAAESGGDVVVEAVTPVAGARDVGASLELGALISAAEGDPLDLFVTGLPDALWATWAVAVESGPSGPVILAASPGAPRDAQFDTPWLPLDRVRRLDAAQWMPPAWRMRAGAGTLELAAVPLASAFSAVLVGRAWSARFRVAELRQLELLADLTTMRRVTALVGR